MQRPRSARLRGAESKGAARRQPAGEETKAGEHRPAQRNSGEAGNWAASAWLLPGRQVCFSQAGAQAEREAKLLKISA